MTDIFFFSIASSIVMIVIFIGIAVFVWLQMKGIIPSPKFKSEADFEQMGKPAMEPGDWFNASVNLVIGILLGVAVESMMRLMTTPYWPLAIITPVLVVGLVSLLYWFDNLFSRLFSVGKIHPSPKPLKKRQKPLPRRLSMPAGLVLGFCLAFFGLSEPLLGWLL